MLVRSSLFPMFPLCPVSAVQILYVVCCPAFLLIDKKLLELQDASRYSGSSMQYMAPWFLRQSRYFNKFDIKLVLNQSIEIVIVEGNMNWLMSHQRF